MQVASEDGSQPDAAQGAADTSASATDTGVTDNQDQGDQGQGQQAGADQGQQEQGAEGGQEAAPGAAAKPKDPTRAFQQRIDELTRARRDAERRASELEAELSAARGNATQGQEQGQQVQQDQPIQLDPKAIDNLATERARKMAEAMTAQQNFDNACNAAFDAGLKAHGDAFKQALQTCGQFGILDDTIVADALATDAPHEVLFALGKDPEEAMRIARLPQAKRIAEFVKLSMKPAPRAPISKAPPPADTIRNNGASGKDFDPMDPNISDEEWHRRETERERAAAAARY